MELINNLKQKYSNGNIAIKLIYINVAIYLLSVIIRLFTKVDYIQLYFGLSSFKTDFISKPWSLFTYMFLHASPWHLIFNMLMLYIVADFYFRYFGEKSFKIFYFIGGICGGLFFLLYNLITPEGSRLIGASAAIYAVFFAMVSYQPNLEVRLMFLNTKIKLLHLALGLLVLGFLMQPSNIGGNISHVGGALFGYFYMKPFERGNNFFIFFEKLFKRRSFLKVKKSKKSYSHKTTPPRDDYEYNEWKANKAQKIDEILEKISRSGYNSLTKEEKDLLFQQGKK